MTRATRTVCWDASIFMALLFFEGKASNAAIRLIEDLYARSAVLAMSTPLETEVIDAIRRRVLRHAKSNMSPQIADDAVSAVTVNFFNMIKKLKADGKIIDIDNTEPTTMYHKKILGMLIAHTGHAVADSTGRLRHDGAGYRDIEHAYHATIAHADVFYTLDAGFKSIINDPVFADICFVILGKAH